MKNIGCRNGGNDVLTVAVSRVRASKQPPALPLDINSFSVDFYTEHNYS